MESRSKLVNVVRQDDSLTKNGMVTNSTSLNSNVDMFFLAGASRNMSDNDIKIIFQKALVENPEIALKVLFWARDIRGGAGERRFFRVCAKFLNDNYIDYLNKIIKYIPEYGRWDDIFELDEKLILPLIKNGIDNNDGLLCKWLPRQNRQNELANKIRKYLGITPKEYRKLIVNLSSTVEQSMCAKDWSNIVYKSVPSIAMNKYRKAFLKNDTNRFNDFISLVNKGKETIKADTLFPHQLYQAYKRNEDKKSVEAQWNNLPNYIKDSNEKILPICDVSGSMIGTPMDVSVSLGVYISERNNSIFKDAFITFSEKPQIQYLKGSLYERFKQLNNADWGMNTDLESVYKLILNKAVNNNISNEEMPTKILIISDMEFDRCAINSSDTAIKMIGRKYYNAGYKMPEIIFWNVNGRIGNIPASFKSSNIGLVSGFSPSILKSILQGDIETPEKLMLKTVMSDRYEPIKI